MRMPTWLQRGAGAIEGGGRDVRWNDASTSSDAKTAWLWALQRRQVALACRVPPTGSTRRQRSVARNSRFADYVKQYKAEKRLAAVTVSAMRPSPQPYWRSSVSDNMFCLGIQCCIYKPDIVNARSYTVCWHGVVSTYVCTSGAKVCW